MAEETIDREAPASNQAVNDISRNMSKWLTWLSLLIFLLIVWGALVRLTGSGLSIPDWPIINGSLLPPMSETAWDAAMLDYTDEVTRIDDQRFPLDITRPEFKTMFWIEYIHRTLAALAGIFFLVIAVRVFRDTILRKLIGIHLAILAVFLLLQGVMGGLVVLKALPGLLIAIHLALALIFFGGIIWTALVLTRPAAVPGASRSAGFNPIILVWSTMILLGLQLFIGGLIAGIGRDQIVSSWPLMLGSLVPPSNLLWSSNFTAAGNLVANSVLMQFIHRWLAFIVFGVFIALRIKTAATPMLPRARTAFRIAGALFGIQIMVGIFNSLFAGQVHVSALHTAVAALLFAMLVILLHDMRYGAIDETA